MSNPLFLAYFRISFVKSGCEVNTTFLSLIQTSTEVLNINQDGGGSHLAANILARGFFVQMIDWSGWTRGQRGRQDDRQLCHLQRQLHALSNGNIKVHPWYVLLISCSLRRSLCLCHFLVVPSCDPQRCPGSMQFQRASRWIAVDATGCKCLQLPVSLRSGIPAVEAALLSLNKPECPPYTTPTSGNEGVDIVRILWCITFELRNPIFRVPSWRNHQKRALKEEFQQPQQSNMAAPCNNPD